MEENFSVSAFFLWNFCMISMKILRSKAGLNGKILEDWNRIGKFLLNPFGSKDRDAPNPIKFLWNDLFYRNFGGILPRGWTSWKHSFVSLSHLNPVFFLCFIQTLILSLSCVFSFHRIQNFNPLCSYIFFYFCIFTILRSKETPNLNASAQRAHGRRLS